MINYSCEKQCVVLGLSGGIDSATSAWLLKKRGFKVVAVTFKPWEYRTRRNSEARTDKRVDAAKSLCEKIGIEHHVLDISEQFK
ncbi:MAG TPA: tRNA 2-thiouridine(34) synthase MnmA, partial [candidate division Zixibacteria bacterium]|nr:tRNA 2-thiouridine(34) synthase MnmA [candidate division Zixibacteria bacterium]